MTVIYEWRGEFTNTEVNVLHAEAFGTGTGLVGFVNVVWDGLVHAWLQDTMVAVAARGRGIGTSLVDHARRSAKAAGCEYLHVDFDDHLAAFYYGACGFQPTNAGLLELN